MCQAAPRPSDLSSYIDRLVETLVVNGPNHSQVAKCILNAPLTKKEESSDLPLSYNQINCLENVHRLLKSQSRPDSPVKSEPPDETKRTTPSIPLTRELLQQHTKRWEDEYRDTWNRRLKRMSVDTLPGSPSSKQMRPSTSSTPPTHWTPAQREEYYRSLAPNPPPPPGKNFQITTVPLPYVEDKITPISLPDRQSAFTAVLPKSLPVRDLPAPIVLSIQEHPSVIQAPSDQQILSKDLLHPSTSRLHWAYGQLGCVSSPPPAQPIKLATDALLMLHETA